jgi:DNA helicase-2/ATP-dependent DNA helicase PcrA
MSTAPTYPPGAPAAGSDPEGLLADLNPAQREAVTHEGGPLLVVAGAGSGKTRVLTRRVAWLVARGAAPRSVLAITFTNKAADVMKERLARLPGGADVVAGTFHAFGARTLRSWGERVGRPRDFTVLDADDQARLLRDLLRDLKVEADADRPGAWAAAISHRKNGATGRAPALLSRPGADVVLDRVALAYEERLRASGLLDFDDLLLETLRLLRDDAEAGTAIRARFRHVLVDEYQDTNGVQADLLVALARDGARVTAVGDPDQSIYSWRGATVRNILRFREDFPGARVVALEENYRSTKRILAAAEAVIARNEHRYEKRLRTSNVEGPRVQEIVVSHGAEEGDAVAERVRTWRAEGIPASSIAVFFRANHQTRGVETALRSARIPYQVVSGVEFFQRREVKDVLAYARLVANPRDDAAFLRVANVPARGLGEKTLERLRAHAIASRTSAAEAAATDVPGISGRSRAALDRFLACLARMRAVPATAAGPVLEAMLVETGYREALLALEEPVERSRVENVDELLRAAREHDRKGQGGLSEFLERTALVSEQDGLDEKAESVSLMTVHAAKGLEFDAVLVAGVEDGSFPHSRSQDSREEVEEERRLLYVAMTRAKRRLAVTIARARDAWGNLAPREPSPFWLDVPDELVETRDPRGLFDRARARRASTWAGRVAPSVRLGAEDGRPPSESVAEATPALDAEAEWSRGGDDVPDEGDAVLHPFFGRGRLVSRQGRGEDLRVVVDFDERGTKTILWRYARLVRLPGGPAGGEGGRP